MQHSTCKAVIINQPPDGMNVTCNLFDTPDVITTNIQQEKWIAPGAEGPEPTDSTTEGLKTTDSTKNGESPFDALAWLP